MRMGLVGYACAAAGAETQLVETASKTGIVSCRMNVRSSALSNTERIARPPRIGAAFEEARLRVHADRADRARLPRDVRPRRDLVTERAERFGRRRVDAALEVQS